MTEDKEIEEDFRVSITRDKASGRVLREVWTDPEGRLHGPPGRPAERRWELETGQLTMKLFAQHGQWHRDGDLPAEIWMDVDNGTQRPHSMSWYKNGKRYRAGDLPTTVVLHQPSGVTVFEQYLDENGNPSREEGKPWEITRDPDTGEITSTQSQTSEKNAALLSHDLDFDP